MVYDGILLGLIVGFIRAGWKNGLIAIGNLRIKGGWVFPVLLIVQFLLFFLQEDLPFFAQFNGYFYMIIYAVGLSLLWINRHQKGLGIIFAGVLLNFLVMLVNGGRMPVSIEAASVLDPIYLEMLKSGDAVSKHFLMDESTRLYFLGDIIPLSPPYPRTQAISIGDVVINVGAFFFLCQLMGKKSKNFVALSQESS
ncbi:DUF5317 domain-containing protein [Paenibacillus albicereus]|uniref:DUF5317 domain-containing protein n=1 Tax=Paenibacillus albicereus TaxID=2726185 RepID=A0A6H2H1H7_9BACL|nr:DUF5317 domain-containing protein [Paenibacillus albicereus]QJC53495.1 DUF5317 domain-containing protein [Paenibacillus albicereus]